MSFAPLTHSPMIEASQPFVEFKNAPSEKSDKKCVCERERESGVHIAHIHTHKCGCVHTFNDMSFSDGKTKGLLSFIVRRPKGFCEIRIFPVSGAVHRDGLSLLRLDAIALFEYGLSKTHAVYMYSRRMLDSSTRMGPMECGSTHCWYYAVNIQERKTCWTRSLPNLSNVSVRFPRVRAKIFWVETQYYYYCSTVLYCWYCIR